MMFRLRFRFRLRIYLNLSLSLNLLFKNWCHHPFIHIQLSKNNPLILSLSPWGRGKGERKISSNGFKNFRVQIPHLILVEMSGFEPPTPCVQGRCSPAELHPHLNQLKAKSSRLKESPFDFQLWAFSFYLVGLDRFELSTSRLSGVRSNQLSYRPSL